MCNAVLFFFNFIIFVYTFLSFLFVDSNASEFVRLCVCERLGLCLCIIYYFYVLKKGISHILQRSIVHACRA